MKALVYHGPNDLRLQDHPDPQISDEDVLLKVVSAGICGTDLRIYHGGHRKYPAGTIRIPGHEVVGDVVALGSSVRGISVGQRFVVAPNWGCGHCRQCITGNNNRCANYGALGITEDGAFAEYMRVPAPAIAQGDLIPLSPDVDPAAAAMIEPFACVLRGQEALGGIRPEDLVVVMGAGPIGILHIMFARLQGARRVIVSEMLGARLDQAAEAGADRVVNLERESLAEVVMEESGGQGADAIIVAAPSHKGQEDAIQISAIGGRINFFGGLPKDRPTTVLDSNAIHYKEILVTGTTACSTADCWKAAQIVASGRLDLSQVISEQFPMSQAIEAFDKAEDRSSLKIVLNP
ncbi:MAG: alcohol dehydrogenase catalytic domain-containing protein [Anaerolineae bacterium]|nr:alcohol dehydrogenase catalytic domain-containing protein [Anaerolineae bacterium]